MGQKDFWYTRKTKAQSRVRAQNEHHKQVDGYSKEIVNKEARDKRLEKIVTLNLSEIGKVTLPDGTEAKILRIKPDGIVVLEGYGDYDLAEK